MRSYYNQIVFPKTACAELQEAPTSGLLETLDPQTGILIENECSIVSAGTELACRKGLEWWAQFPFVPGYGSVGRVVKIGPEAATRGIPGAAAIREG
ncbi:MAG: hypothetical protein LBM04_09435, partial [Opitutaceae bacterium]|nr:hypothetical protein [Opitutaceae bacterium]